jgi:hypothetical protein
VKLAQGLLSDCEVRVCYRQEPNELELVRTWAGLTDRESELLKGLPFGRAIWRVGRRSHVVQHRRSELERTLTDTDRGAATVAHALAEVRRLHAAEAEVRAVNGRR